MRKGIFITATGTDVGKTYVSGLLVKEIQELGLNCGYYKPVLSGATVENGAIVADDALHVSKVAGLKGNHLERVSYVFKPAVSPHLAANMDGCRISLNKIKEDFERISTENEFTVVEGAGGIICPLNLEENLFMYDIPKTLRLATIVVADAGLGTINYTFLTVDFLKRSGVNIRGIVLNNFDTENFMHRDNREVIERISGVTVIATVEKNANGIEFEEGALKGLYE